VATLPPLRSTLARTRRRLRGHDIALHAAGLTFYAGIALVPSLLVGLWVVTLVVGEPRMDRLAAASRALCRRPSALRRLPATSSSAPAALSLMTASLAVVPATFYGEGLRRGFAAVSGHRETLTGWRGRLRVLPLFVLGPVLLLGILVVTPWLARLLGSSEAGATLLGIYVAFLVDWLALWAVLAYAYRVVGPEPLSPAALAWGSGATASVLAGFVQGFVLFLALPLDLAAPFGGSLVVGAVVALGLWLWLLHVLVLVGYEATRDLNERRPQTPVVVRG
jgi:membrane protein